MSEVTILTILLWIVFLVAWWFFSRFRLEPWIAHRLFGMKINRRYKPGGKWYGYTRGILHLKGDTSILRWKTILATLIYWVIATSVALFAVIWLVPQLAGLLMNFFATNG